VFKGVAELLNANKIINTVIIAPKLNIFGNDGFADEGEDIIYITYEYYFYNNKLNIL
jgi:hypothetical protein